MTIVVQLTILRTLYSNAPGTHWNLIGNPNYQMPLEPKYKQQSSPCGEKQAIEGSHVGRCQLYCLAVVVLCLQQEMQICTQNLQNCILISHHLISLHQLKLLVATPSVSDLCLPLVVEVVVWVV